MVDWDAFTLFLYIFMRMTGVVFFNPLFGRNGIPRSFQAGLTFLLTVSVYGTQNPSTVEAPEALLDFVLRLFLELGVGAVVAVIMRFFFYIPDQSGEFVDTQMGMSMGRMYDATSQTSMTVTANLLYTMMVLLFFACNGHITLLRILCTSGEIIPFGQVALGDAVAERAVELFAECALLAVKLSFPILAAELMGQIGMGILMRAIPQINVFAINIELKVIIGELMLLMMIVPMGNVLLEVESTMLSELRAILLLMR